MAENLLVEGEARIGWLADGDEQTPHVAVMLCDTGSQIELTVPLQGMFGSEFEVYRRWFAKGIRFGDDPDRTKYRYEAPRVLRVDTADGPVVLVGCRTVSWRSQLATGQGTIVANYAVLGGSHLEFETINGLRTEIPAFAAWTRVTLMKITPGLDGEGRTQSVKMELTSVDPIPLAHRHNLVMTPSWDVQQRRSSFSVDESVVLQTTSDNPIGWSDHLDVHRAVLELVSIAAWRRFGIAAVHVHRVDDPQRQLDGAPLAEQWAPVSTHRLPKHQPWSREPDFLFPYDEVGPAGVRAWLTIRDTYRQVMQPLLTVLHSENPWGQSSIVQSGIALEALGYLIDVEKNGGSNLNDRGQISYRKGLEVIVQDMDSHPMPDVGDWIKRSVEVYMGAKHVDRDEPDEIIKINTHRENLLALRFWIGEQIGVTTAVLRGGLKDDRLGSEFVLIQK